MRRYGFSCWAIGSFLVLSAIVSAIGGSMMGAGALEPWRRPLTPDVIQTADRSLSELGARREDFTVRAPDGIKLRGWKVRAREPNGAWVLLMHGQSDNRAGMIGQAQMLLRHRYNLVMMDAREHGESEGTMATYGWLERHDTQSIVSALYTDDKPAHLFALGSSMGAAIALQSAAVEPRIEGVIAESSFSDLHEVAYDYVGFQKAAWLGKTIFLPGVWTALAAGQKRGGFSPDDVSPEKAVAARAFPILLICDLNDTQIPCRHSRIIFAAAKGPKTLWEVPGAGHASALGAAPREYEQRVIAFLDGLRKPD
jgi:alpha-beta hydrolase superfamily lysophospholipase